MNIELYNSLSRRKEKFEPTTPRAVTMYVCGPTVYSHPHIGNARPAVAFDVLFRLLSRHYDSVTYARNITDIEDKINAAAKREGVDISVITRRYAEIYHQDMEQLGVLPPTMEPWATDHVEEMKDMISTLIAQGNAYVAEGHVLFEVATYDGYGRLSGRDRREMIAGARVEVAPFKRDPADFVLWKPSDAETPGWDSPWGRGRPGWHLECSAMVKAHLGETIDIHGGGADLQFPHHENEIAQSCCTHGGIEYVRYWMHNGFVNVNSEKMSKSLGNVLLVRDLLAEAPGEAVRFALLSTHYRKPIDWDDDTLPSALRLLDRFYGLLEDLPDDGLSFTGAVPAEVESALADDMNTPLAISGLHALAGAISTAADATARRAAQARLVSAGKALGLFRHTAAEWQASRHAGIDVEHVEQLISERAAAKQARDFATADRIRDELALQGVLLNDGPHGTTWRRAG